MMQTSVLWVHGKRAADDGPQRLMAAGFIVTRVHSVAAALGALPRASSALVVLASAEEAAIPRLRARCPLCSILVLVDDPEAIMPALLAGARDAMVRNAPAGELELRLRALAAPTAGLGHIVEELVAEKLDAIALAPRGSWLPSRPLFLEQLDLALDRLQRHGGALSVMLVDLDRGREDQPLPDEPRLIRGVKESLRQADCAARLEVGRVGLILTGTDVIDGYTVGERVRSALQPLSVSVGVAGVECLAPEGVRYNTEALCLRAHRMLCTARRQGGNLVEVDWESAVSVEACA